MVNEGYMSDVKQAIVNHISEADSSLSPDSTHVLQSTDEDMWKYDTDNLPIVTVRIGPSTDQEVAFGRKIRNDERGIYTTFFFTAHLFHNINETENQDKTKTAMDLAEVIKEHLLQVDDEESGIAYYNEVTLRETPSRMAKVAKVIIEGYVFVKRSFV
jgi:hypothetical protein